MFKRWSVRRIISEPQPQHPYAIMALSAYDIWTDRAYCDDEEEALHIAEMLNIAENARNA